MERYFTKTNIFIWLVIALAILNISTIATILWHKSHFNYETKMHSEIPGLFGPPKFPGWHLKEKLKFSGKQSEDFDLIRKDFHISARDIAKQMQKLRLNMLNELAKENIDTVVIYKYAQDIGNLHADLKKKTIKFYIDIKNICNPSQRDTLAFIFKHFIQTEDKMDMSRKRMPGNFHHKFEKNNE